MRLWIKARTRFSLLLHQLAKTGQDKFAALLQEHMELTGLEIVDDLNDYIRETGIGSADELSLALGSSAVPGLTRIGVLAPVLLGVNLTTDLWRARPLGSLPFRTCIAMLWQKSPPWRD